MEASLPLPELSADEAAHAARVAAHLTAGIAAAGGKVSFAAFMAEALYAPGLGYYAAGARKFGDAGAWGARIKQGFDTPVNSALKGKGAMGAQGGGDFSDVEIARAVAYMANNGGAKFEEPKAPAAEGEKK